MPKPKLIRSNSFPYHVTARSNNRDWFYISLDRFWEILLELLKKLSDESVLKIHSVVLMSNHLHLMLSTPEAKLDEGMRYLLSEISRKVNSETGRINHLFGGPYKWSLITNNNYYLHCLKYIYRNPIAAGICSNVEDYRYSSLHCLNNSNYLPFPIHSWKREGDWLRWGNRTEILKWLNTSYPNDFSDYIKRGLSHAEFRFPKSRTSRKVPEYFNENLPNLFEKSVSPTEIAGPKAGH